VGSSFMFAKRSMSPGDLTRLGCRVNGPYVHRITAIDPRQYDCLATVCESGTVFRRRERV